MQTTTQRIVTTWNWHHVQSYKTHAAAKAAVTRKWAAKYGSVRILTPEEYERRPDVEVTNIMSGKKVTERAGTPNFMSVGSEAYWSM